jgi:probable HAF family extracellular repeat protein
LALSASLLVNANAINDYGQIAGIGWNSAGMEHAFLLTPTPEPTTLFLLALGGLAMLRRRRKSVGSGA